MYWDTKTQIWLLHQEQSDQGRHCLSFLPHLLDIMYYSLAKAHCSNFFWIFIEMIHSMTKTTKTKWHVRLANTQISMGISPVQLESLLSAWRNLESLPTHWVHSKDSDQTGKMPRPIWVFAGPTGHFVGFVVLQLKSFQMFQHWGFYGNSKTEH